jgi:protein arginine kinase
MKMLLTYEISWRWTVNRDEEIARIFKDLPAWARSDWKDHGDIVLGSEVSMARNVIGHKFTTESNSDENKQVLRIVSENMYFPNVISLDAIGMGAKAMLYERQLIMSGDVDCPRFSRLMVSDDEMDSVTINELDHVRIRSFSCDLNIENAVERAVAIESLIEKSAPLESVPVNILDYHSDIAISAFVSTPATHLTSAAILTALPMAGSGLEASPMMGGIPQSANMIKITCKTRVNDVDSAIKRMKNLVDKIKAIEIRRRDTLLANKELVSIMCQSWGSITNALKLTEEECLRPMSWCVAGINSGVPSSVDVNIFKNAIVGAMSGHLLINGGDISCVEESRALHLTKTLVGKEGGTIG